MLRLGRVRLVVYVLIPVAALAALAVLGVMGSVVCFGLGAVVLALLGRDAAG